MHYLYLITRDDGEQYVGVSQYPSRRMKEHFAGNGSRELKGRSFTYDILQEGKEFKIFQAERDYILEYKPGLNKAAGGHGGRTCDQTGVNNPQAKLSETEVIAIRNLAAKGMLYKEIANRYNITQPTVSAITTGLTWKNVGGPRTHNPRRDNGGSQRTNADTIMRIKELRSSGLSFAKIAKELNVSASTAHKWSK